MSTSTSVASIPLGGRSERPAALTLALEEIGQPRLSRAIVTASAAVVVLFVAWTAITHVPEVAVAQGAVATADPVAPVQHLEGGIIEAVLVADGQAVRAGQPLVRFASMAAQAELDQLRTREASLRFQSARLRAFLDGAPFEAEEGDFAQLAADQRAELDGRLRARLDRQAVLKEQLAQREAEGAAIAAQREGLRRQFDLQANELALREKLLDQGLTTRVAVLEVRRAVLAASAEIERLDAQAAGNARALAEAAARLVESDSTAREEAGRELSRVNLELAEVTEAVRRAFERVGRLTVLAPADGTVKGLAARSPGQVVPPGGVLMELVPRDVPLLVEARLSPRDVGFARIGQPVTVKVQTFDYARYGTLDGTLVHVAATTTPDEHGQPYYVGRIQLASDRVGHGAHAHQLIPGMTVQADIVTGGKSLLQYLLKPVHASMSESFRER
jgi:HlyD family secretion protein/adhesin transport system membrane fusion protein